MYDDPDQVGGLAADGPVTGDDASSDVVSGDDVDRHVVGRGEREQQRVEAIQGAANRLHDRRSIEAFEGHAAIAEQLQGTGERRAGRNHRRNRIGDGFHWVLCQFCHFFFSCGHLFHLCVVTRFTDTTFKTNF